MGGSVCVCVHVWWRERGVVGEGRGGGCWGRCSAQPDGSSAGESLSPCQEKTGPIREQLDRHPCMQITAEVEGVASHSSLRFIPEQVKLQLEGEDCQWLKDGSLQLGRNDPLRWVQSEGKYFYFIISSVLLSFINVLFLRSLKKKIQMSMVAFCYLNSVTIPCLTFSHKPALSILLIDSPFRTDTLSTFHANCTYSLKWWCTLPAVEVVVWTTAVGLLSHWWCTRSNVQPVSYAGEWKWLHVSRLRQCGALKLSPRRSNSRRASHTKCFTPKRDRSILDHLQVLKV